MGVARTQMNAARSAWHASGRRRLILAMFRQAPVLTSVIALWAICSALLPNALFVLLGRIVDQVPSVAKHGLSSPPGHRLIDVLIVFGFLFVATLVMSPIQIGLSTISKVRLTFEMQERLMRAVSEPIGISHLEDPELLDRVALAQGSLMSQYPADAPMTLAQILAQRWSGGIACIIMGTLFHWWIALVLFVFWRVAQRVIRSILRDQVRSFTGNAGIMRRAEYFRSLATEGGAAKEIRVFGIGGWLVGELRRHWLDGMAASWRNSSRYYREVLRIGLPALLLYVGICLYIAYAAYTQAISLASAVVVLGVLPRTLNVGGFNLLDVNLAYMLSTLPELETIESELARDYRDLPGTAPSDGLPRRQIRFESVSFAYPGATDNVFDGLELEIPAGRSTAIVGANGAGKTTLVKLLARLHDPTGGRITIDDRDVMDLEPSSWQQRVAVVFQDFNKYPVTAWDNVAFGAYEHCDDRTGAVEAARRAGALDIIESLPSGWDTMLSRHFEGGVDLSGGEWQRVTLARALFAAAHGANVLVLDEPTAWLDVRGEAAFYDRFLEITHGLTTVVISHRFSTVRLADHICVLEQGVLIEEGNHDELIDLGGTYARMFRLQASRFTGDVAESM